MTSVVYSAPPVAAELPASPWTGLTQTWQGWDGSSFDFTDVAGGCILTDGGGVTGMHMPAFDQYVDEYANVDGGIYQGSRAKVRNPEWTLSVWDDASSAAFKALYRALWNTFHPDRPGLWTVRDDATGESRSLVCQYRSSEEVPYGRDPLKAGFANFLVTLLAVDPFWRGVPISSPVWGALEPVNFTGPDDAGPPFFVGAATSLASAQITNPGDVDASLLYVVTGGVGGLTSFHVEVAGGSVGFGAVAEGSVLRISTDPAYPVAFLDGVDVSGDIDPWDPRPIPAQETSPLTVTLVGNGTVQASFTPKYHRAF